MSKSIEIDESELPVGMVVGRYKDENKKLRELLEEIARRLHDTHAELMHRSERQFEKCSGNFCVAAREAVRE